MCSSVARHMAISRVEAGRIILALMRNRTSIDPAESGHKQQAPLSERLWRNQLGIMLAIALTIAAAGVLLVYHV